MTDAERTASLDALTIMGVDPVLWRSSREIARVAGVPRWQAPTSLRRLRAQGLVTARTLSSTGLLESRRIEEGILLHWKVLHPA